MVYIQTAVPNLKSKAEQRPRQTPNGAISRSTPLASNAVSSTDNTLTREKSLHVRSLLGTSPEPVVKASIIQDVEEAGRNAENVFTVNHNSNEEKVQNSNTSVIFSSDSQPFLQDMEQNLSIFKQGLSISFEQAIQNYGAKLEHEIESLKTALQSKDVEIEETMKSNQEKIEESQKKLKDQKTFLEAVIVYLTKKRKNAQQAICYSIWKARFHELKSLSRLENIASIHYQKECLRKALTGWNRLSRVSWKQLTEKRLRSEMEKNMFLMSNDYENRIAKLTEKIHDLTLRLQETKSIQEKHDQQMKQAFLRGISALNLEAMGIFNHAQDNSKAPQTLTQQHHVTFQKDSLDPHYQQAPAPAPAAELASLRRAYARLNHSQGVAAAAPSLSTQSQVLSKAILDQHRTSPPTKPQVSRKNGLVTRHYA